jgi:precorrin-6B C5,15-methyltransferase / cobalt-precorrin-6B C5,C15-methyltransferase
MSDARRSPINVVGFVGEPFGAGARQALAEATVVVGSARQLALFAAAAGGATSMSMCMSTPETLELRGPLPALFDAIAVRADAGDAVCVLASGDPGFFGIVGALGQRFGPERLVVHPAPSSVSLAFGLVGLPWDDATVVSAHGRPLSAAIARATGPKSAVLTSPDNPPEAIGRALQENRCGPRLVYVASHLGTLDAAVIRTDLAGLAAGHFDPMSVVLLLDEEREEHAAPLSWGRPESSFAHRNGMITKAEVRAVALGKLALPAAGVLWDLGAGSGSVGVECALLRPGLRVIAVERDAEDAGRVRANAASHGVSIEVIHGDAPHALGPLPDPDRVFVGGGGLDVLDAALARLRPDGAVVATFALMERAVQAQRRLGSLVQLSISRGVETGDLGIRLSAENPVFVCWGPTAVTG